MRVGLVQLTSDSDRDRNLKAAERLVRGACAAGSRLVVLPEMFACLGPAEVRLGAAEPLDGPTGRWAGDLARELGIHLVAGSILEAIPGHDRHYNTTCVYDPTGNRVAVYRKIHLFDCDFPGAAFRESQTARPGASHTLLSLPEGPRLGLGICYDLRFPELFRILALNGADLVALPAAFTERTGRDHWEVLLRARAIENQIFVLAAGQVGGTGKSLRWFGRSMVVDPWGVVLAQAPDRECFVTADLDLEGQHRLRQTMPALANRRPEAYVWPKSGAEPTPAGAAAVG